MATRGLVLAAAAAACALLVAGCSATTTSGSTSPTSSASPSASGSRSVGDIDGAVGTPDPSSVVAAACPSATPVPSRLADVVAAPQASWTTVCIVGVSGRAVQATLVGDPLHDAIRTAGDRYDHGCALVARFPRPFVVLASADGSQRTLTLDDCGILLGSDIGVFLSSQGRAAVARVLAPVTGTRVVSGGMSLSLPAGWTVTAPRVCSRPSDRSVSVWPRWPVGASCPSRPLSSPSTAPVPVASVDLHPFTALDIPTAPWRARTSWNGQLAYLTRTPQGSGPVTTYLTVLAVPSLDAVLSIDGVDAATTADLLDRTGMVWPGGVRPAGLATTTAPSPSVSAPAAPTAMPS